MNGCFHGLDLTHIFLNGDAALRLMVIAFGLAIYFFKFHRYRAGALQCFEEHFELFHIPGQFIDSQRWYFTAISLAYIKNIYYLKGRMQDFFDFFLIRAVRILQDFPCIWILFIDFYLLFVWCGSQDADSLFSLIYLAAELLLPGGIACHQCGVRLLHGDQNRIVQTVIVEAAHGGEPLLILIRLKQFSYSCLQLIGNLLHTVILCHFLSHVFSFPELKEAALPDCPSCSATSFSISVTYLFILFAAIVIPSLNFSLFGFVHRLLAVIQSFGFFLLCV